MENNATTNNRFKSTYSYNLIYVFQIGDEAHKGYLKVGKTTIKTEKDPKDLFDNCSDLNKAAKERINPYTVTAGIVYNLIYTTLAIRKCKDKDEYESFMDKDIHRVLTNSGIKKHYFDEKNKAQEWFETDLQTVMNAINAYKYEYRESLTSDEISKDKTPIVFRPEQKEAINKTLKRFRAWKDQDKACTMLWNAKMRFGKTLSAHQVVKEMNFKKTLIISHRPVVDKSWQEDFDKIFYDRNDYLYRSKDSSESLESLDSSGKNYIYFASLQDLRGSNAVGGKFDKNDDIFKEDWDLVIVDEAHEGTQTELGKKVTSELCKKKKKPFVLALTGTAFNIVDQYEEESTYTWDYVMEQQAKASWDILHYGDPNPYDDLPRMNIFTYKLADTFKAYAQEGDIAFNFAEFFRTWTGDISKDGVKLPKAVSKGDFVHQADIIHFLDMLCKKDDDNNYPYSTEEYRSYFRHSFWVLPGVAEAKAMSELLRVHDIFANFEIINVAGDGDVDDPYKGMDPLDKVNKVIGDNPDDTYTITLTCGRLTTGVTVKPWTAVLLLYGTYSTDVKSYMQTIFRVQTPAKINGRIKDECYVFDFAPDRTLKMVAEATLKSTKPGETSDDRDNLGKFLNFCPVIGLSGSSMRPYDVDNLMQEVKKVYAQKVMDSGFDNTKLYNNNVLMNPNKESLDFLNDLKKIIGKTQSVKLKDINLNNQGLTNEEREQAEEISKKPKKVLTKEEEELLRKLKEAKKERENQISILRGISIRMPLMIFAADLPFDEDITLQDFLDFSDDQNSWKEFMPTGVTKEIFKKCMKFYDEDIFIQAGKLIRKRAKDADNLESLERLKVIVSIFDTFKNPDKETVLTPWRVVNMHMADTIGGYCFYDEKYENKLETPRYVDNGDVTQDILKNTKAKVLDIDSKTALYPLYVTYSIYKERLDKLGAVELTLKQQQELWDKTVRDNIYIICKSKMAKKIAERVLFGYRDSKGINAHAFDDIAMQVKNKKDQVASKINSGKFWGKEGIKDMKFDAIVGNPPYQQADGGAQASSKPIYNYFVEIAKQLNPQYISLIMPSRWMTGGKGLDDFRKEMINDKRISLLHDFLDPKSCFPNVDIKGGVCYFLWDKDFDGKCQCYLHEETKIIKTSRYLHEEGDEIFIRIPELINIKKQVWKKSDVISLMNITSPRRPYGLSGDVFANNKKYNLPDLSTDEIQNGYVVYGLDNLTREKRYIPITYPIPMRSSCLNKYKLFVTRNYGSGFIGEAPATPIIAKPGELCTETFIEIGPFDTDIEVKIYYLM